MVVSVEKISEAYLLPALELLLAAFPFIVFSFHSDNASEYINKCVAKLLNKLGLVQIKGILGYKRHDKSCHLIMCSVNVVWQ